MHFYLTQNSFVVTLTASLQAGTFPKHPKFTCHTASPQLNCLRTPPHEIQWSLSLSTQSDTHLSPGSKLHSLEYLDLSHNQLATVPTGLPKTLIILHLGRNRIRQVEAARLRGAKGLRYLLLQHNELGASGLPAKVLRPLRGLHALHLYGNRLERVPRALPRRLWALLMPHNHVAALGARDLASTPGLAELNLAYNRLTSAHLHHRAFCRLRTLRCLDLAGNQLTRVPVGLPGSLQTLRLQRNQLRTLEPESLAGLGQLQELRLAHNWLRVGDIGPGTWHELQALQVRSGFQAVLEPRTGSQAEQSQASLQASAHCPCLPPTPLPPSRESDIQDAPQCPHPQRVCGCQAAS